MVPVRGISLLGATICYVWETMKCDSYPMFTACYWKVNERITKSYIYADYTPCVLCSTQLRLITKTFYNPSPTSPHLIKERTHVVLDQLLSFYSFACILRRKGIFYVGAPERQWTPPNLLWKLPFYQCQVKIVCDTENPDSKPTSHLSILDSVKNKNP